MPSRKSVRSIVAGGVIAALAGGMAWLDSDGTVAPVARAADWFNPPVSSAARGTPAVGPDFSAIVERYGPAVVNVSVEGNGPPAEGETKAPASPRAGQTPVFGLGSGFIVRPDGVILTSAHVVAGASAVTVRLSDQRTFAAEIVGLDRPADVAVLRIDARDLPSVVIGDASDIRVGSWVLAIGSPYGFDSTATAGIVSAMARNLPRQPYVPFIQTDVPVNPGNSGGPLFSADGEVVGINAQIYSDTGGFQGLSFAVPIDVAMKVAEKLLAQGEVRRGWLGAAVQEVTQPLAEAFRLPNPAGALVNSVQKDGPAAKAGLRTGDVVLKIDGAPVQRATELPPRIADIAPGTRVPLQVWREGQAVTLEVAVGELKLPPLPTAASPAASREGLGLSVRPLSPREARAIKESSGLLIEAVSGPAAHAGMQPGDVILAVNGEPVGTVEKLRALARKSGNRAALLVRRGEEKVFLPLSLG